MLSICVDGPYGNSIDIQQYSHILLVAGGIGITPLHSMLRTAVLLLQQSQEGRLGRLQCIRLVWSAKEIGMFDIFRDTFTRIISYFSMSRNSNDLIEPIVETPFVHVSFELFCSTARDLESVTDKEMLLPITKERINVRKEVAALAGLNYSMVFACGPESLIKECEVACMNHKVAFHAEVFLL